MWTQPSTPTATNPAAGMHAQQQLNLTLIRRLAAMDVQTPPSSRRLAHLAAALRSSDLFARMEMVGSSILFVYDAAERQHGSSSAAEDAAAAASAHMIDFAKTAPVPLSKTAEGVLVIPGREFESGGSITHAQPWVAGNHEDGYLLGLDSLIRTWESVDMTGWAGGARGGGEEHV